MRSNNLSHSANWLHATVLGANGELVLTASMMLGVGAVKVDKRAMLISWFASLLASVCRMDIAEFIRVPGQGGLACRCCNLICEACA